MGNQSTDLYTIVLGHYSLADMNGTWTCVRPTPTITKSLFMEDQTNLTCSNIRKIGWLNKHQNETEMHLIYSQQNPDVLHTKLLFNVTQSASTLYKTAF